MAQSLAEAETAVLNMENTDIKTLISTVADKTGKNFIVDPRVKGKVTVISHKPVTRDELYQIFLSILEVHGFAAVPADKAIKIVPDATARQSSIPTATSGSPGRGDELVTRVVSIDYVSATQLVPILRPLIPQQGHMAAFPSSNVLIVSDRAENIARIIKLVRRIDRPGNADVEVITLQHASATELVRILSALNKQNTTAKGGSPELVLVADERTNSILLSGDKANRLRLRALVSHLDTPNDVAGDTQVIYLKHADAKSLVPVLTSVSSSIGDDKKGAAAAASASLPISIQADDNTNALVITAPAGMMRSLQSVIRQLDIRRAQVLVEAVIAEISTTKSSELGVQWLANGSTTAENPAVISQFPGSSVGIVDLATDPATALGSLANGLTMGIGDIVGTNRFAVLVRAIASDDEANVLSTPSLVMLDNEEAEIVVGQNVPFVTGSQQTTGGLANPFQTIQRQDVGLTLKVKPQINEGNAIKLDITQEVSSVVADSTSGAADIVTNKRSIKTSVLADDGAVVVLGGLITDDLQEGVSKVPLLGDIPLMGALFRSKTATKVKRNLMVFLHPVILRDASANAAYSSRKYNYIRGQQIQAKQDGVHLLPDEVAPVLPTLDEFLVLPPTFNDAVTKQQGNVN
ncbi:type II secretion system secretin GspD [Sulfuriflexus sp.]|uniref:type II secretion system secretin GspD n=1 Tax=Sulfuriflexus sp. TaxID=2015443 RepID=UPI0028CC62AC|nr:type II secretion system secretin GspD [Sulfuriflexus sp.]MDT8403947.1 type II secretion system secretin GspD [Sulfuriflexus sp.]